MPREYPDHVGLMIAVPLTGRPLVPQFTFAFMNLHPPMNFNLRYSTHEGPQGVDFKRNWFCKQAIEMGCKYIFFIDEDVTPPPHAIRQLYFDLEHNPKAVVAGGIYCHKSEPPMPMVFRGNGAGPYWDWKLGETFEVSGIGFGCAMLRVSALANIPEPWFKNVDDISPMLDGVAHGQQYTEDLFFCERARNAGWAVLADSQVICQHWDMATGKPTGLPSGCKPLIRSAVESGQKKIVDLGCGEFKMVTDEGHVVTVDVRDEVNADYRADLRSLPFGNGVFDIVHSSHVFEHFFPDDMELALKEAIRVLKQDGELRLVLPNIEWAAQQIIAGTIDADVQDVIYGARTYNENFHKTFFTPAIIDNLLRERGFVHVDVYTVGYNIVVRAWRVEPPDEEVTRLKFNAAGSNEPIAPVKIQVKEFRGSHRLGPNPAISKVEFKPSASVTDTVSSTLLGSLPSLTNPDADADNDANHLLQAIAVESTKATEKMCWQVVDAKGCVLATCDDYNEAEAKARELEEWKAVAAMPWGIRRV